MKKILLKNEEDAKKKNEEEAAAVRLIFEMTQNHYPYQEIIDRLHANGYRTKIGNYFQRNSLYEILRNPRYAGTYVYFRVASADYITKTRNNHLYNSEPIIVPNGIPAIITQKLFDNVQKILDNRKNKHAKTYKESEDTVVFSNMHLILISVFFVGKL